MLFNFQGPVLLLCVSAFVESLFILSQTFCFVNTFFKLFSTFWSVSLHSPSKNQEFNLFFNYKALFKLSYSVLLCCPRLRQLCYYIKLPPSCQRLFLSFLNIFYDNLHNCKNSEIWQSTFANFAVTVIYFNYTQELTLRLIITGAV